MGGLLAVSAVPGLRPRDALVTQLHRRLAVATDEEAPEIIDRAARLDVGGMPLLVAALDDPRQTVARRARAALDRMVGRWQRFKPEVAANHVAALARELAAHTDTFSPAARRAAAEVALRLLRWPMAGQKIDREQLIADCETVLRASAIGAAEPPPKMPALLGYDDPAIDAPPIADVPGRRDDDVLAIDGPALERLAHLPGGNLPVELERVSPLPPSVSPPPSTDSATSPTDPAEPGLFEPDVQSADTEPVPPNPLRPGFSQPIRRRLPPVAPDEEVPEDSAADAVAPRTQSSIAPQSHDSDPAGRLDDVALIRLLATTDPTTAADVEDRLRSRGFGRLELELARRFVDRDVRRRVELAESLPRLRGVDARRWLLWLARDPAPEVRLVAFSLLATTGDPAVLQRLRQLERDETDPRVLRLAEQILDQPRR